MRRLAGMCSLQHRGRSGDFSVCAGSISWFCTRTWWLILVAGVFPFLSSWYAISFYNLIVLLNSLSPCSRSVLHYCQPAMFDSRQVTMDRLRFREDANLHYSKVHNSCLLLFFLIFFFPSVFFFSPYCLNFVSSSLALAFRRTSKKSVCGESRRTLCSHCMYVIDPKIFLFVNRKNYVIYILIHWIPGLVDPLARKRLPGSRPHNNQVLFPL